MKYLVTGVTGFVGRWIARQLVAEGHEVVSLVRNAERNRNTGETGVEMMRGDITKKDTMRDAMYRVDGVYHVATWSKLGLKSKAEIAAAEEINVGGTRNVLELVRELKIPRCVYTSSLSVFSDTKGKVFNETYRNRGPWLSVYDRTMWQAHYEVAVKMQEERVPVIIVQPGLVYGPGDQSGLHEMWVSYLSRRLPMLPKKTAFCWGHVEDIARGHIQAMEKGKPGESYLLAGPQHTLVEALEIAEKITGIKPPRLHPGPLAMKFLSALMGVAGYVVKPPPAYSGEGLRVLAGTTYLGFDQKARLELDFLPRSLETGLRETLAFEQAELARNRQVYDSVTPEQFHRERMEGASNAVAFVKSKIKIRKAK